MAMQKQLWSMNALATEFQWDRRTTARRLEGLEPVKVKEIGNRTEKSYYMSDVLQHLNRASTSKEAEDAHWEDMKHYFGKRVFPGIVNDPEFVGTLLAGLTKDQGLTRHQAIEIYKLTTFAIMVGISNSCNDPDMGFETEGLPEILVDMGTDEYVKNHWPEFGNLEKENQHHEAIEAG